MAWPQPWLPGASRGTHPCATSGAGHDGLRARGASGESWPGPGELDWAGMGSWTGLWVLPPQEGRRRALSAAAWLGHCQEQQKLLKVLG